MSSARVNRPTSCSSWVIRSAEASDCLSAGSKRVAAFSRSCRFHFESCSSLRLWGPPTHFCLGTFTAESLKNNFGFKLGSEVSSFSFRHRILLSSRWILYHNLVLESGPNFRWQYTILVKNLRDKECQLSIATIEPEPDSKSINRSGKTIVVKKGQYIELKQTSQYQESQKEREERHNQLTKARFKNWAKDVWNTKRNDIIISLAIAVVSFLLGKAC